MTWIPERLLEDVEAKPAMLRALATSLRAGTVWPDVGRPSAVLLIGIGSSRFAAEVAARRMRAAGIAATAESSSIAALPQIADDTLVVVISAGGSSAETLAVAGALSPSAAVAIINAPTSALAGVVDCAVPMGAGEEVSGVASKTFTATLLRLLELEALLGGAGDNLGALADSADAAAAAVDDLLARRGGWLGAMAEALVGPDGTWLLSPLERWSSAMQGALMLREVPRRLAVGCETGEWSHVDVYLTLPLDYRALVFVGSPWDDQAADWLRRRGATYWAVGGELDGAAGVVRYDADEDPTVALLAEVAVAELLAVEVVRRR